MENYYVGIDGGSESVRYSASAGYTDDGGVALATGYSRLSMRNNLDVKINSKLSFAMGFDYSKTNSSEYPNQMNVISRGLATPRLKRNIMKTEHPQKAIMQHLLTHYGINITMTKAKRKNECLHLED